MNKKQQPPKTLRGKITKLRLDGYKPCGPALCWADDRDPQEAWRTCKHGDWLRWLVDALQSSAPIGPRGAVAKKRAAIVWAMDKWRQRNPCPRCNCASGVYETKHDASCNRRRKKWNEQYRAMHAVEIRRRFDWRWVERRARKLGLL